MHLSKKLHVEPSQPLKRKKLSKIVAKAVHFFVFLIFMVLLAGHENMTPPFGKNTIDFFDFENRQLIENQINNLSSDTSGHLNIRVNELVSEFYKMRDYKPAWTLNYTTNLNFYCLKKIIDSTVYYGFPKDYFKGTVLDDMSNQLSLSKSKNKDKSFEDRTQLEIQSTKSALLVMIYMRMGIISEDTSSAFMDYTKCLPRLLNVALENNSLTKTILSVQPKIQPYQQLLSSIPEFVTIYESISDNKNSLSDNMLTKALNFCDLDTKDSTLISNEKLLEDFQKKYSLNVNGKFDTATQKKMQSIFHFKYLQICLNLDRLRKVNNFDSDYLFVNIPEFKMHLIEGNIEHETFNVIVGRTETPTPILSSKIERIIANPDWTVPTNIAQKEMLSKIRTDSGFLQRNGYTIVNRRAKPVNEEEINWEAENPFGGEYYIRQNKSDNNALGKLKFVFPNSHSVYMHDTPSKRLFANKKRTYSHGCVRIQNPEKLAQYLTNKCGTCKNDSVNIYTLIADKRQDVLNLEMKMPIHIQYITNIVDESGSIYFLNDVYNLDEEAINSLFPG